jgi:hypothetical protein
MFAEQNEKPKYFVVGLAKKKKIKKDGIIAFVIAGIFRVPVIIIKQEPILDRPRAFVVMIKNVEQTASYQLALEMLKPGNGDFIVALYTFNEV